MKSDIGIINAIIITSDFSFRGGLEIKDGIINKVVEGDEKIYAEEIIDLSGKLLLPGIIDSHVHFNEPGREELEGYETGSRAAAAGGVTTFLDMPFNASPPTRNLELLNIKRACVLNKSIIDYGHWGLLEANNINELKQLHDAGVIGFKTTMITPDDFLKVDEYELFKAMEYIETFGNIIGIHAENDCLINGFTKQVRDSGSLDIRGWLKSRPPITELIAIEQVLLLAAETRCPIHIVHTTIPQGIHAINRARSNNCRVTVETCPHYLALNEDDLIRLGPVAMCIPPLRSRDCMNSLWQEVLNGNINIISSDHCPCPSYMKETGKNGVWDVWRGINGIQTLLPIMLTEGFHKRKLQLNSLVRMTSLNPAKLFGLYPKKGHIAVGADADLIVIDIEKEWVFSSDMLFSKHKLNPYNGLIFKGALDRTIVRGRTVYSQNQFFVEGGYGQLVKRNNN